MNSTLKYLLLFSALFVSVSGITFAVIIIGPGGGGTTTISPQPANSPTSYSPGSFDFYTLIGSVLNYGVESGNPVITKSLLGGGGWPQENNTVSAFNPSSPYTAIGSVPISNPPIASVNGGGVSFSTFQTNSGDKYDNIMRLSNLQEPFLAQNAGIYSENEYLWLTGFPVYDQAAYSFALLDSGGAYQITFNKQIPSSASDVEVLSVLGNSDNNGQTSFEIYKLYPPTDEVVSPTNSVAGGSILIFGPVPKCASGGEVGKPACL
ncbi:MAG TPA: hypothetical protein VL944_02205, partial [Candidatus Acidoferrum sp.]|nr:hypothetical protein [Candidatus Acidoferrum sp.]